MNKNEFDSKAGFKTRPTVEYLDWGLIDYQQAWDQQGALQQALVQQKRKNRELAKTSEPIFPQIHHLIFCEHNPVYTLGKSGSPDHLLLNEQEREAAGVQYYKINRGGDITFHGPGQIVAYPIFDLDEFFTDVHKYVRILEEAVIRLLATYEIKGARIPDFTGVWIKSTEKGKPHRKICAIGVHLSRWVTLHGLALNVNTDLKFFEKIIPCGINDADKTVTSMEKEVGGKIDTAECRARLKIIFAELFNFKYKA